MQFENLLLNEPTIIFEIYGEVNIGCIYIYIYIYRVSQEERTKLREGVPYVKLYRYNPKTPVSQVERLLR